MFDSVRNNKRIVQVFLALITLPFAFWGVESYVRNGGAGDDLATVGGSKITTGEYQAALREQQDQLRQAMGANFNPAILESAGARKAMLDQLINQRVLLLEAGQRHIVVGDETLQNFITKAPPFQVDGKFSLDRYQAFVQAQGKSQPGFEYELRQDLVLRQLASAVGESGVVSRTVLGSVHTGMAEKRTVSELRFAAEPYLATVKIADEAVQKYYEANRKEFEEPEQVRVEYATLSMDAIRAQAKVSDTEIKARYDSQKSRYEGQEERRASHILIQADPGNADARAKAKAKAEELLAQVKSKPAEFGKLAKQHSQDPGSAGQDGDLGFFGRGMMVKPFEDATFALKEKEISGVVETEHGFHIIQLSAVKAGKGRTFDEVRPEIEAELKQQAAQKLYAEAAETFSNLVYEQADSLNPVVDRFKLTTQTSGWIRKGDRPQPGTPLANPKLAAAIFSDDVVKNKRNTEAVEVQSNVLVAARLAEHKPATLRELETVKASIRAKLQRTEALQLASKAGEAKLAELKQGKDEGDKWGAAQTVSRTQPLNLSREALKAVFKMPAATLPAYAGLAHPDGGYAIYKLTAMDAEGSLDPKTAESIDREVKDALAQEEMNAYLTALRSKYKVEINKSALEASKS